MILAHGGAGGAVAEVSFVLVPVVLFWMLSRWAKRRAAAEAAGGEEKPGESPPP